MTDERRSIEVEIEVPGTPEQVWEAIATGPGVTAWFSPTEIEEREGGAVSFDMGSGMEPSGVITTWDPPRRYVYEEAWKAGDEGKEVPLATEWLVEARSGGTCVVRVVSSAFASGGDWDRELESMHEGWTVYLENLRLYLTHFPGQHASTIMVSGSTQGSAEEAWTALSGALGLPAAPAGELAGTSAPGAPVLAGRVEGAVAGELHRGVMLRMEQPAPGLALVFVYIWRGQTNTAVHASLFGEDAAEVAAREQAAWSAWMEEHFPSAKAGAPAG
jgi:uncharacterized protein YndB with AHSA1/START domain